MNLLCFIIFLSFSVISCGGGGGGAGGASIPASEYTTHNPTGWGGSGYEDGSSSGGSNGNNIIQGGTPLTVTGYSYNGQTYSNLQELVDAINTDAFPSGETPISFTCTTPTGGTETRAAKVTKSSSGNTIEHQYKATYTVNGTVQSVLYYRNNGISLTLPAPDNSVYGEDNGVFYHANGWTVAGQPYTGGTLPVASDSGDLDLGTITGGALDQSYGFTSSGELVVNGTGTITVDNTGRSESISKITLPDSGNVALNLSGVSNLNLSGTWTNPAITNGANLTSVTMPSDSYSLGESAFQNCSALGSIDLTNCTSIGENAFNGCNSLQHVTLGNNLSSISYQAFFYCPLQEIDFSSCSSFTIGESAFYGCSAIDGSVDLSNCTSIGVNAFSSCSGIDDVTFGDNVTIGTAAFNGCSSITAIVFGTNTSIGASAFYGCSSLGSVSLVNCTSLGASAFQECDHLTTVTLGSIDTIPNTAFSGCSQLTTIDLSAVQSIGNYAFGGCNGLISLTLTAIESIGNGAFYGCTSLSFVSFGNSIDSIDSTAFYNVTATFDFATDPINSVQYGSYSNSFDDGVNAYYQSSLYVWSSSVGWEPVV